MILFQSDTTAVVDTLTQSYADKWQGSGAGTPVIDALASNGLIFVVLAVTLVIWFVLLFFMIRVDRRLSKLEASTEPTAP